MRICILGSTGDVGGRILGEALLRGHSVVVAVRNQKTQNGLPKNIEKRNADAMDWQSIVAAARDCDVLISAVRPTTGNETLLVCMTESVLKAASHLSIRTFITGGAARLKLSETSEQTVLSMPGFLPEGVIPIAKACQAQYELCLSQDADWVYLSPPSMLVPGKRTAKYRIGGDTLVIDESGNSQISMEDFAVAMLDEVEAGSRRQEAFTVGY